MQGEKIMEPTTTAALIGAGGALAPAIGSFLGGEKDREFQKEWNRIGYEQAERQFAFQRSAYQAASRQAILDDRRNFAFAREQFDEQKRLARHGLSDRIQDAKNAGIHPLAALGAPTAGGAPIHVGGTPKPSPGGSQNSFANTSPTMQLMGQSIGQSLNALANIASEAIRAKGGQPSKKPEKETWLYDTVKSGNGLQIIPDRSVNDLVSEGYLYGGMFYNRATQDFSESPEAKQWLLKRVRKAYPNADGFDIDYSGWVRPTFNGKTAMKPRTEQMKKSFLKKFDETLKKAKQLLK
jgi:hypothetical protein